MTIPAFLFGLLISSFYGSLFHLIIGGGFGRLIVFLFFSAIGFWIGHFISYFLNLSFGMVGPIYLVTATLGSWIFIAVGLWLSRVNRPQ